jgi:DNA mismatch repair protein MutS2
MDTKMLQKLEFNKVLFQLKDLAVSKKAKGLAMSLQPFNDIHIINKNLDETSGAATLILRHGTLSLGGLKDIRHILNRLEMGGDLSAIELLHINSLLYVTKNVKSYGNKYIESIQATSILPLFSGLEPLNELSHEITRCIISEEEIADDASQELFSIRRNIKLTNDKVRQQLSKIISSSTYKSMLQDSVITIKNNRYCVPVKAEHRSNFPGMIHEHSSSGSTLFIEPMAVVELNNQLREFANNEKKEIERILSYLSAIAAQHTESLAINQDMLEQLDFIFAKGNLAIRQKASRPHFNTHKYIHLKQARHPLLDPATVVPTDIYIGKEFNTLVITGPNTGGKTVTLKTVGLLSLMGQSGLHIPAFDNSSLTVLSNIFADIGDEQSIEQSLSTFSSHMKNIVHILEEADDHSLVLFDELGAGTDPTEGAALAMAILQNLYDQQILTIATTHYSELKVFALSTDRIQNASCEFDVATLRPTYKLLIGVPGKSNAFAISKRLGLQDNIIDASKKLLEGKAIRFEDVISELEESKKRALAEKEEALKLSNEAKILKEKVESMEIKLKEQRESLIKSAKEEAYGIIREAKAEADQIIKSMNQLVQNAHIDTASLEKKRSKLRSQMSSYESDLAIKHSTSSNPPKELAIGDTVFVSTFNKNGSVVSLPNKKGELEVQLGIIKTKVNIANVKLVNEKASTTKSVSHKTSHSISQKSLSISPEIDVRGYTSDEALGAIDKYLDDAYLSSLTQVTIIHGKGTGALKQAIHSFLRKVAYVDAYRLGNYGEGDSGVTIVSFK